MEKTRQYQLMVAIFLALSLVFGGLLYINLQKPRYRTWTETQYTYTHRARYNYVAHLDSNLIYNRSTLGPGEGTLYTGIINHLDLSFIYEFHSDPPASEWSTNPDIQFELEAPEKWTRLLTREEAEELLHLKEGDNFTLSINHTQLDNYMKIIGEETGLRVPSYKLNIRPTIHLKAEINGSTLTENFTPELTIEIIQGGEKGNHISIENLEQTRNRAKEIEKKTPIEGLDDQKDAFSIILILSLLGTTGSGYTYWINRPEPEASKKIEKTIKPHEELIIVTGEDPPQMTKTVPLDDFEDLVKTAEILARPILRKKHENLFYIIDESTVYIHELMKPPPEELDPKNKEKD